jgi:hypothetical protein
VTTAIEKHCRWSMEVTARTRAVIAIHEFGRACESVSDYVGKFPLIEDCAYAYATRYRDGSMVGHRGDYALWSLSKMFSVHYGGVLRAPAGRRLHAMSRGHEDYLLSAIGPELLDLEAVLERRQHVWAELRRLFCLLGTAPFFEPEAGEVPSVFMFRHEGSPTLPELRVAFETHGVEASAFWGNDAFYVPAHQNLSSAECLLMAQVYAAALEEGQ